MFQNLKFQFSKKGLEIELLMGLKWTNQEYFGLIMGADCSVMIRELRCSAIVLIDHVICIF